VNPIISWTLPPRRKSIGIVNAGIENFCRSRGYADEDSLRLQVSVEGVYGYCVGNILAFGGKQRITITLLEGANELGVDIEHDGPGGEWDEALKDGSARDIRRTGFDAMGLFIADEFLHNLVFDSRYDVVKGSGHRVYSLLYRMTKSRYPEEESEGQAP